MQGSPAAFPFGIPGIGELMDGAVQHAPQFSLHCIYRTALHLVRLS